MRSYPMAAGLASVALAAWASGRYVPRDPVADQLRRTFLRILEGIRKANDYGYPNISRQVRRQIERKMR